MENLRGPLHRFGMQTFAALKSQEPNGNILFSPFTASAGLMLIYIGANATTKQEIEKAMHLTDLANGTSYSQQDIQMAYRLAIAELIKSAKQSADNRDFQVFRQNRLFIQEGICLTDDFVDRVKKLRGEITFIDFKGNSAAARREVNSFVQDGMNGKVTNCFADGDDNSINKGTRLILTNGICFRARWDISFDASKTSLGPFYDVDGKSSVDVPMMKAVMSLAYVDDPQINLQYLEIPYTNNAASLLIFLPKARNGFRDFQATMSHQIINKIQLSKRMKEIELTLPKFTLQTIVSFKDVLKKAGVVTLFTPEADLSKMVSDGGISLSAGHHSGYYNIDENGTDVGNSVDQQPDGDRVLERRKSVTSLGPIRPQVDSGTKKPIAVVVDHPFVFGVRHNKSGIMMCVGKLENIVPPGKTG